MLYHTNQVSWLIWELKLKLKGKEYKINCISSWSVKKQNKMQCRADLNIWQNKVHQNLSTVSPICPFYTKKLQRTHARESAEVSTPIMHHHTVHTFLLATLEPFSKLSLFHNVKVFMCKVFSKAYLFAFFHFMFKHCIKNWRSC